MDPTFEGKVIGCDSTMTVGEDTITIAVSLPYSMVDNVRVTGKSVVMRSGTVMIWFDSREAAEATEQIQRHLPPDSSPPPAGRSGPPQSTTTATSQSRWRRRRS